MELTNEEKLGVIVIIAGFSSSLLLMGIFAL